MFNEYTVTVGGETFTVLDLAGENGYRVARRDGSVTAFPALSGDPCEANASADIAAAIANPPPQRMAPADIEHLADITLDGWARAWGYTTAARAVTYVGDPNPRFNAEGTAIRNARSELGTTLAAAAEALGEGPLPTRAEVEALINSFAPIRPVAPYA